MDVNTCELCEQKVHQTLPIWCKYCGITTTHTITDFHEHDERNGWETGYECPDCGNINICYDYDLSEE